MVLKKPFWIIEIRIISKRITSTLDRPGHSHL